jgi:hypothetical protein
MRLSYQPGKPPLRSLAWGGGSQAYRVVLAFGSKSFLLIIRGRPHFAVLGDQRHNCRPSEIVQAPRSWAEARALALNLIPPRDRLEVARALTAKAAQLTFCLLCYFKGQLGRDYNKRLTPVGFDVRKSWSVNLFAGVP